MPANSYWSLRIPSAVSQSHPVLIRDGDLEFNGQLVKSLLESKSLDITQIKMWGRHGAGHLMVKFNAGPTAAQELIKLEQKIKGHDINQQAPWVPKKTSQSSSLLYECVVPSDSWNLSLDSRNAQLAHNRMIVTSLEMFSDPDTILHMIHISKRPFADGVSGFYIRAQAVGEQLSLQTKRQEFEAIAKDPTVRLFRIYIE